MSEGKREFHVKQAGCGHTVTHLLAEGTNAEARACNERVIARPAPDLCGECRKAAEKAAR